jgi:hypothetical protein
MGQSSWLIAKKNKNKIKIYKEKKRRTWEVIM